METHDPQFDDPALKQVVRRSIVRETAPAMLRQRIAAALETERHSMARSNSRSGLYGLAAVLLIGLGALYYFVLSPQERPAPKWFSGAMVQTHQACSALPDHHLLDAAKGLDAAALRKVLQERARFAVMVPSPADGWKFSGVGICKVSNYDAVHQIYTRGDETVSIFSLPARALYVDPNAKGINYSQTEQDYLIAGFATDGTIQCLVGRSGSGQMSLRQMIRLRNQWRSAYFSS